MNRLEEALYNPSNAGPGVGAQGVFSVSGITYDGIGNIMSLNRQGITQCGGPGGAELVVSAIDQLTYTYANGSQLSEVVDNATHPDLKDLGVKNGGGTYQYDAAGRMTHDNHRGLVIEYNHLDLPRRITDQNNVVTDITYDATGRKWLQQTATDARIYAGAVVLTKENGTYSLDAANTSDGRLVYDAEEEEVYPEFYHKDHLGNVRVAFADRNKDGKVELLGPTSEITQQNDYYPFGLRQEGDSLVFHQELSSNRYRYNGKEFSEELGLYDYGARWYDPAIGRWNAVDPLADQFANQSPYHYGYNNPLRFIDPDGRSADDVILNRNGNVIADDGKTDGHVYVVGNSKEARQLKSGKISIGDVTSMVQLPGSNVRSSIGDAVNDSNSPSDLDPVGGKHEEGLVWGTVNGEETIVKSKSGGAPSDDANVSDQVPLQIFVADDKAEQGKINHMRQNKTLGGTAHVHPSGDHNGNEFKQPPSPPDRALHGQNPTTSGYSIVVGAGGKGRVYLYDGNGTKASLPLSTFLDPPKSQ